MDELLSLASTLDPWLKNHYNKDDRIKVTGTAVMAELMAMVTEEDSPTPGPSTASAQVTIPLSQQKTQKQYFGSYFKKPQEFRGESLCIAIEKEIQSYLMIHEVDSDVNPLDWWKKQEINFHRLGKLAKQYLCIPASSSPSERAFST